jgi:hypothetical protein
MLNLIFEIWWPNIRKVWLVLNHDTLNAKYDDPWMRHMRYDDFRWHVLCLDGTECAIWYVMVLCLDDPLMRKMIYYGFVIWCFLNEKYDIWWLCTSMTLECEIWYMMVLWLDTLDCEIWYQVYITLNSINFKDNILPRWPLNAKVDIWD